MGRSLKARLMGAAAVWALAGAASAQTAQENPQLAGVVDRLQQQVERLEAEVINARQRAEAAEKEAGDAKVRLDALERRVDAKTGAAALADLATAYGAAKP
ncbi:MAG: hypothetical protein WA840_22825, partial [Caulobacteraceae bacterium]